MKIAAGKVVSMHYVLTDEAGQELDQSAPGEPLVYLHGKSQIVPGLEKQLEGLSKGDKRERIEVKAADAYGENIPELLRKISRTQFPSDLDIQPGMQFMSQSADGHRRPFTVLSIEGDQVEIDANHPMAGKTLFFKIEVDNVRDATSEELAHGHAHGPGGHHHH